jgi:hypothetical protein
MAADRASDYGSGSTPNVRAPSQATNGASEAQLKPWALPELLKLDRYDERRATARRDRASREIDARKMLLDNR